MDQQGVEEFILEYAAKRGMTDILQDILERRGMESFQVLFLAPIRLFLAVVLVIIKKDDVVVFRRVIKILKLINKKMKGSESKQLKVSHSSKIIRELKRRIVLDKISRKETTGDAYRLIDKYFPYIRVHPDKQTLKERRDSVDRFQTQEVREQLISIVCRNEFRHHEVPPAEKKFLVQQVKNYVREVNDDLAPTKIEQLSSHNGRFHYDFFNNTKLERNGIYNRLVSLCVAGPPSEKDLYNLLREIWNEDGPKHEKKRRKKMRMEEEELDNDGENLDERREEVADDFEQGALLYQGDISTSTCSENGGRSRQIADSLYLKIMKQVMESDNEGENEKAGRSRFLGRNDFSNNNKDLDQSMEQSYSVERDLDHDFIESTHLSRSRIRTRRQSPHASSDVHQPRTSTPGIYNHHNQTRRQSPGVQRDQNQSRTPSPGVRNDRYQTRRQSPRDPHRSRGQSPDGYSRALTPSPNVGNHLDESRTSSLVVGSHYNQTRRQSPDASNHCNQSRRQSIYENRALNTSSNQSPVISIVLKSRRPSPRRQAPDDIRDLRYRRQSPRRQAPDDVSLNEFWRQSPGRQAPDDIRLLNGSRRQSLERQVPNDIQDLKRTSDIRDLKSRRQSPRRQAPNDIIYLSESKRQAPDDVSLNESWRQSLSMQAPDNMRHLNDSRRQSLERQAPNDIRDLKRTSDIRDLKCRRQSPQRQVQNDIRDLNDSRRQSPRRQAQNDIIDFNEYWRQSPRRQSTNDISSRRQSPRRQAPDDIRDLKSRRQSPRRQVPDDIRDLIESRRQSPKRQASDDIIYLNESRRQAPNDTRDFNDSRRQSLRRQAPNDTRDFNDSRRQSPRRQAPDDIKDFNESRRQSPRRQALDDIRDIVESRKRSPKRQAPDDVVYLNESRRQAPNDTRDLNESRRQLHRRQAPGNIRDIKSRRQSPRRQAPKDIRHQSPWMQARDDTSNFQSKSQAPGDVRDFNETRRQSSDDIRDLKSRNKSSRTQFPDDTCIRDLNQSLPDQSQDHHEGSDEDIEEPMDTDSDDHDLILIQEAASKQKEGSSEMTLCTLRRCSVVLKDCKEKCIEVHDGATLKVNKKHSASSDHPSRQLHSLPCSIVTKDLHRKERDIGALPEVGQRSSSPGTKMSHISFMAMLGLVPITKVSNAAVVNKVKQRPQPITNFDSLSGTLRIRRCSVVMVKLEEVMEGEGESQMSVSPTITYSGQEEVDQNIHFIQDHNRVMEVEAPAFPSVIDSGHEVGDQSSSFQDHNMVIKEEAPVSPYIVNSDQEVRDQSTSFLQDHNGVMEGAPVSHSIADSGQEIGDQATPFLQHDNGVTIEQPVKVLKRQSLHMNRLDLSSRCGRLRECSVLLRKYDKSTVTHVRKLILRKVSGPSVFKRKNYVRMSIHIPHCGRMRLRQRLPTAGLYM